MGLNLFYSSASRCKKYVEDRVIGYGSMGFSSSVRASDFTSKPTSRESVLAPSDPRPDKFKIAFATEGNGYVLAAVRYPNCTNFEGLKFLLFKGVTTKEVLEMKLIDPHFLENGKIVARFAPTPEGYNMAMKFLTKN